MGHQLTFADSEFNSKCRQTRKEIFLSSMDQSLPWQDIVSVIKPLYPKAASCRGRRHYDPLPSHHSGVIQEQASSAKLCDSPGGIAKWEANEDRNEREGICDQAWAIDQL